MNKRPLVIFGNTEIAELAHFYFGLDSGLQVAAFTVDAAYVREAHFHGLPVVPFERLAQEFPAADHDCFIALGYSRLNGIRKEKYLAAKALGYRLVSYVSTRTPIPAGVPVGDNCLILENSIIQPFACIGNNVTLWAGNHVGHHVRIKDHTFISSQVVLSGGVEIGEQCFIGVNSALRDHIRIGDRCVIGAGCLLLEDAAADGVYRGAPTPRSRVPSGRLRRL